MSQIYAIGFALYFKSYWNVLDTVTAALVLTVCPLHVLRVSIEAGGAVAPMLAFSMLLVSPPAALALPRRTRPPQSMGATRRNTRAPCPSCLLVATPHPEV